MPSSDQDGLKALENKVSTLDRYLRYHLQAAPRFPAGDPKERIALIIGWFNNCAERVERFLEKSRQYPAGMRYTIGLKLAEIRAVLGPVWTRIELHLRDLRTLCFSAEVDSRVIQRPEQAGRFSVLMAAPMGEGVRLC